jgi:hypothetical protein
MPGVHGKGVASSNALSAVPPLFNHWDLERLYLGLLGFLPYLGIHAGGTTVSMGMIGERPPLRITREDLSEEEISSSDRLTAPEPTG